MRFLAGLFFLIVTMASAEPATKNGPPIDKPNKPPEQCITVPDLIVQFHGNMRYRNLRPVDAAHTQEAVDLFYFQTKTRGTWDFSMLVDDADGGVLLVGRHNPDRLCAFLLIRDDWNQLVKELEGSGA